MPAQSPTKPDLTWPALLGHWTAFAQSSLALLRNSDGDRWRSAVPAIINMQAVTFALADLDKLTAPGERALALDKADILIRSGTGQLHALWGGDHLPLELVELIRDAGDALEGARNSAGTKPGADCRGSQGVEWRVAADRLVVGHPGELVDRLLELGFDGELFVPTPGVPLFRGSPAAFAVGADGSRPDEHVLRAVKEFLVDVSRPQPASGARQVYRQIDFALGRPVRDLVVSLDSRPSGQPLLVPAIKGGKPMPVTLPPRKGVEIPVIEVVFERGAAD